MDDYGKSQNNTAGRDTQAPDLADQLNLLEAVDRRITPGHLARRYRQLVDDIGYNAPPAPLPAAADGCTTTGRSDTARARPAKAVHSASSAAQPFAAQTTAEVQQQATRQAETDSREMRRMTTEPRRDGQATEQSITHSDAASRLDVPFDCPNGHHFTAPFAVGAELPQAWECRVCGTIATAAPGGSSSPEKPRPPRSHWEMLLERRSVASLEDSIAERLALIRETKSKEGHSADTKNPAASHDFSGIQPVQDDPAVTQR